MKKQTKFGLVLAAAAVISVSVASLVSARGWVQQGADWYYVDNNNDYVTETIQSSGASKFYLGEDGAMVRDYFLEDDGNGNTYYFGSNGAMVTNTWVAIESAVVDNQGSYVPDNYWYYFQASGKAMKGSTTAMKKATIDGKKYGFNQYGQMSIGWVDELGDTIDPDQENPFEGATYYCGGDNDGALRSGWVTYYDGYDGVTGNKADYTNLYFYFQPSNNKIVLNDTKKINGKTYAFDVNGVMLSGWDVYEEGNLLTNKTTYFSGEDDGHQVKKGWVYAVPSESVSKDDYDDNEEKYMYFGSDGDITSSEIKKINGKYYVFNNSGIMKTGIVLWCTTNTGNESKFVKTIDTDYAKGSDIAKKGILQYDSDSVADDYRIIVDRMGYVTSTAQSKVTNVTVGDRIKLHYFGDDGARRTGLNNIEFNDDVYTLNTNNSGDKGSGIDKKKYYSLGIALKADADLRYGIYNTASDSTLGALTDQTGHYVTNLANKVYKVLTTSGTLQKGNNSAKKDANGNFWLIDKADDHLVGIWSENVKMGGNSARKGLTTRTYGYVPSLNGDDKDTRFPSVPVEKLDVVKGGSAYTIAGISSSDLDDFSSDIFDTDIYVNGYTWTAHVNAAHNEVYFTLDSAYSGYAFQQTLDGKQNVWMPFGMKDDSGNTADDYEFNEEKLDDSYFLNCYID